MEITIENIIKYAGMPQSRVRFIYSAIKPVIDNVSELTKPRYERIKQHKFYRTGYGNEIDQTLILLAKNINKTLKIMGKE